jgi:hypothetical protein
MHTDIIKSVHILPPGDVYYAGIGMMFVYAPAVVLSDYNCSKSAMLFH